MKRSSHVKAPARVKNRRCGQCGVAEEPAALSEDGLCPSCASQDGLFALDPAWVVDPDRRGSRRAS